MIRAHLYGLYQFLGINWRFGGPHKPGRLLQRFRRANACHSQASRALLSGDGDSRGNKVDRPASAVPVRVFTQCLGHKKYLGKFHKVVKKKTKRNKELRASNKKPLRKHTEEALDRYFASLNGDRPGDLYDLVLGEVEQPLFKAVMEYTHGNQSQAAGILGINRGTLRKKLKCYSLIR